MDLYKQTLDFQEALIKHLTTTEAMDEHAYETLRKELIEKASLKEFIPPFLIQNRTVQHLNQSIKASLPTYAQRRTYIRESFSRLLDGNPPLFNLS
jgi:hypothetical protein